MKYCSSCTSNLRFLTRESSSLPISYKSIIRWNKEISKIHVNQIFDQNNLSEFFTFEVMLDESTWGEHKIFVLCIIFWNSKNNKPDFQVLEMKDLATCTGISVAQAIYDIFDHFKVNSEQYFVCISDNTNYMSGKSGGAISVQSLYLISRVVLIYSEFHADFMLHT